MLSSCAIAASLVSANSSITQAGHRLLLCPCLLEVTPQRQEPRVAAEHRHRLVKGDCRDQPAEHDQHDRQPSLAAPSRFCRRYSEFNAMAASTPEAVIK